MRLALFFLLLATAFSFASLRIQGEGLMPPVAVAARPSAAALAAPSPAAGDEGENGDAAGADLTAPPLFRPAQAAPEDQKLQPGQRFALVGVAGEPGALVAFLRDQADGRAYAVRVGERVGDWTLADISHRCAVLRQRGASNSICM